MELPPSTTESSVPASASELLLANLSKQTRLLRIARQEAKQYKMKCEALKTQITSAKKRQREQSNGALGGAATNEEDAAPAKKPSPDNRATSSIPDLVDVSDSSSDDDEVSLPAPDPKGDAPPSNKQKAFQELNSLLCAYKDKQVKPGSPNLPYDLCAELCREEADAVLKWDAPTQ